MLVSSSSRQNHGVWHSPNTTRRFHIEIGIHEGCTTFAKLNEVLLVLAVYVPRHYNGYVRSLCLVVKQQMLPTDATWGTYRRC
jgi:hypothetical protein